MSSIGGKKTISTIGSVFLLINNSAGPGIALLPALYQQSGWAPTLFATILLAWLTFQVGIYFTEAIKSIPNNNKFDYRVEYIYLIKYYCQSNTSDKYKYKHNHSNSNNNTQQQHGNDNSEYTGTNNETTNTDESRTVHEQRSVIGDIESRFYHSPMKDILKGKKLSPIYTSRKHVLSTVAQFAFYLFLLTLLISNIIQVCIF